MAINSKIAGIVTGLGVGLGGGVLLAILNPLISNNDSITVLSSPSGTEGNLEQDSIPVPVEDDEKTDVTGSHVEAPEPIAEKGDAAPENDSNVPRTVKAGRVEELDPPRDVSADVNLDPTSQEEETKTPERAAALQDVDQDLSPKVSTDPAVPIDLEEPKVDAETETPEQPSSDGDSAALAPSAEETAPESSESPEAPSDEDIAKVSHAPTAPREANTSGTFETGSSRLKTTGTAGFGSGDNSDTGSSLPKIGSTDTDEEAETADAGSRPNALVDNAVAFESGDKPLVSIILMDAGAEGLALETLTSLTLPVTFSFRADDPGATERAEALHAAGFEVLAMAPSSVDMILTGGLSHEQVSKTVDRILAKIPGAVGLIDTPKAELQRDRALSRAVAIRLGATGHGLVTYAKGFNTAAREAEAFEVASDSVRRVLDAKDESSEVITRYLDRAVLDARRGGHVVLLGSTRKKTVAAIVNWALSSKARGIALAPVSASLLASLNQ